MRISLNGSIKIIDLDLVTSSGRLSSLEAGVAGRHQSVGLNTLRHHPGLTKRKFADEKERKKENKNTLSLAPGLLACFCWRAVAVAVETVDGA